MKTKHLLLVALGLAALVLLLQRFGAGPDAPGGDQVARDQASSPQSEDDGSGTDLVRLANGSGADGEASRQVATTSKVLPDVKATPAEGPTRTVTAEVIWPDAARPSGPVEVIVFSRDIGGAAALRATSSTSIKQRPMSMRERVFSELGDGLSSPKEVRKAVVAVAPAVEVGDRRWTATLEVPEGAGRVFAHVIGSTYYTRRATIIDPGATQVAVRPVRGAKLQLEVSGPEELGSLAGLEFRVTQDVSTGAMIAMGQDTLPGFRVDGILDEEGRAQIEIVPAEMPLQVLVPHDDAAPSKHGVDGLLAGTTELVQIELTPGATVTGHVLDSGGQPISDATVTAYTPGRAFGFDDEDVKHTTSDDEGQFRLVGLPEGQLIVRGDAVGYLQSDREVLVDLRDGEVKEDVDLSLDSGASISGRVVDANGAPVAGIEVEALFDVAHLFGPSSLNAARGIHGSTSTNDEGVFRIRGLGNGPFSLRCKRESRQEGLPAQLARVDSVMPDTEDVTLTLISPIDVRGTLVDDLGAPTAGLQVRCSRLVSGSMGDVRLDEHRATSGEQGEFALDLPAGNWELSVVEETHITTAPLVFEVPGTLEPLEVVCSRAATARGRVLDPDGSPIEGANVFFDLKAGRVINALMRAPAPEGTRADAAGRFTLLGLPPGEITITATHDNLAKASLSQLTVEPGGMLEDLELRLSRGGTIEGICFDNEGKTAPNRLVTVQNMAITSQRVVSSESDGTFRVEGLEPGHYQVVAVNTQARSTGGDNESSINQLFKNMKLASAEVVEGEVVTVFLGAPPTDPVDVSGRITQDGEPFAGGTVTWLPASTGMQEKMKFTSTDSEGRYSLTLDEPGDFVVTVAKLPGGTGQQMTVEFDISVAEGVTELTRDFEVPGGMITGTVLGADGDPAPAIRVSVAEVGGVRTNRMIGGSYAEIQTDARGAFEVKGLRPGLYQVSAGGAVLFGNAPSAPARVTVGPLDLGENGRIDDVELRLSAPCSARVTVVDEAGKPVSEATIFLRDSQGRHTELFSMVATGAAGKANLQGLAEGNYTVAARTTSLATVESAPFRVEPGETTEISLVAQQGTAIVAVVKGASDNPVPSARVQLLDDQGRDVSRRMGLADMGQLYKNAAFNLSEHRTGPLPPGRYTLVGEADDGRTGRRKFTINGSRAERRISLRLK